MTGAYRPPGGFARAAQAERERNDAWAKAERNRLALAAALKLLRAAQALYDPGPEERGARHELWNSVDALLGGK